MKKVDVKGVIIPNDEQWIYDMFGIEATSPNHISGALKDAKGDSIEVHINSGGGSVFDGSEIYTTLKEYKGDVTIKIVGLAASAASVIAMAGNKVLMSPTAQMMIHNASIVAGGDHRDMAHMSGVLKNVNQTVANAYKIKSGIEDKELLKMMDDETWLTPQQALENNLIDEVMFEQNTRMVASGYQSGVLPQQVIEKIRNEHVNPLGEEPNEDFYMNNLRKKKLELMEVL